MKPEETTQAEQEAVLNRAADFDRLLNEVGWVAIQDYISEQINAAILKAAEDNPLNAEEQRLHVIQWNAKRELNDGIIAWIVSTRAERDRILRERKEQEEHNEYVNSAFPYTGPNF